MKIRIITLVCILVLHIGNGITGLIGTDNLPIGLIYLIIPPSIGVLVALEFYLYTRYKKSTKQGGENGFSIADKKAYKTCYFILLLSVILPELFSFIMFFVQMFTAGLLY